MNKTSSPFHRPFLIIASLSGALAVAIGAMGAHALEAQLDARAMEVYQTAAEYHFYHTLALLAVAILWAWRPNKWLHTTGILFIVGILLFSGSLYALSVTGIGTLGMIAPVGGLSFIAGWLCLGVGVWKGK